MKKLFTAMIVAMASVSASANFYVQGDLGSSNLKLTGDYSHFFKSKKVFTQRLSIGYEYGNLRTALDYTHFGKIKSDSNVNGIDISTNLNLKSVGITQFYDFHHGSNFVPYLGARLGLNHYKATASSGNMYSVELKESSLGFGALVGVQYKLTESVKFNLGAEYNQVSDVNQYGGNLGIRYTFK